MYREFLSASLLPCTSGTGIIICVGMRLVGTGNVSCGTGGKGLLLVLVWCELWMWQECFCLVLAENVG